MDEEFAAIQMHNHKLATAVYPSNAPAEQLSRELVHTGQSDGLGPVYRDVINAQTDKRGAQTPHHGLDFG